MAILEITFPTISFVVDVLLDDFTSKRFFNFPLALISGMVALVLSFLIERNRKRYQIPDWESFQKVNCSSQNFSELLI